MSDGILIAGSDAAHIFLNPRYANRYGLVAGATGTGKTVTRKGKHNLCAIQNDCVLQSLERFEFRKQAGNFSSILNY